MYDAITWSECQTNRSLINSAAAQPGLGASRNLRLLLLVTILLLLLLPCSFRGWRGVRHAGGLWPRCKRELCVRASQGGFQLAHSKSKGSWLQSSPHAQQQQQQLSSLTPAPASTTKTQDVANTFAPSVGAKALTMRQALLVAAVFEFSGAVLMVRGNSSSSMPQQHAPLLLQQLPS